MVNGRTSDTKPLLVRGLGIVFRSGVATGTAML